MGFEDIIFWHWWVLAVTLIILEVFAPGAFFLWMAISAAVVGVIIWIFPSLSWENQFLTFSILSIASIVLWRIRLIKHPTQTERSTLNRRAEQYIGRIFTLKEPIIDGIGTINVDDSIWRLLGNDCETGCKIRIVSTEGASFKVEKVENE